MQHLVEAHRLVGVSRYFKILLFLVGCIYLWLFFGIFLVLSLFGYLFYRFSLSNFGINDRHFLLFAFRFWLRFCLCFCFRFSRFSLQLRVEHQRQRLGIVQLVRQFVLRRHGIGIVAVKRFGLGSLGGFKQSQPRYSDNLIVAVVGFRWLCQRSERA